MKTMRHGYGFVISILLIYYICYVIADNDLLSRISEGDDKALVELLDDYHNYLMVVGTRYIRDRHRVQDLIHDLLADIWNSNKKITLDVGVKSYLRGALINKCLASIRKDKKMDFVADNDHNLIDHSPLPSDIVSAQALQKAIDEIIEDMPAKCRAVFEQSRLHGKSHQEISEQLNISKKTIENHMTKALRILRESLKKRDFLMALILLIQGVK